jgi:hypothetical protein
MITAFELAGFFSAHAIWCVSDGDTLIPMFAYTGENDQRQLERLAYDDLARAAEYGKQKLELNETDANDAVLLYDARVRIGEEKLDAIVAEIRAYFSPDSKAVMAVPYTSPSTGRFRVHKPKLMAWERCEDFDMDAAMQSFFKGVAGHEKGSAIWNKSLDETK